MNIKSVAEENNMKQNQEWFKLGTLENISFEDAEKFVKDVQESNPSLQEREYRIIEF